MLQHIDLTLAVKLASTALLVVVATGLAARFGAFIGAMIAAIPISAGPSYLFIAMENDAAFVSQSALTSLAVNPMTVVFLLISAAVIERLGVVWTLVIGLSIWFAGAYLLTQAGLSFEQLGLLHAVLFAVCIWLSRPFLGDVPGQVARRGWFDILLRAAAVVAVVGSAVLAGRLVGPKAAGVVALIPVVWISMTVIIGLRLGGPSCSAVLANGIVPMIGFWLGLSAMHLMAIPYGSAAALSVALALSIGWTLGLALLRPYIPLYNNLRRVGA